ncbi:MAG: hypothetical protein KF708_22915 [Pirellulales bacterium]|nr:hypothetical protein [Pirellulales bacterium]
MVTLVCLMLLVVFLLLAALVLDWTYLVLVQRDMQQRSDLVALAAAPALLDEDTLRDAAGSPLADQTDDVNDASHAARTYRLQNNAATSALLEIKEDDLVVTPGYVADVHAPRDDTYFDMSGQLPTPSPAFNALRIDVLRSSQGANPVGRLLRGFWNAPAIDVASSSLATLDNVVVGFRPTTTTNAPVVPLAIHRSAWQNGRVGNLDLNDVRDLELRLAAPDADIEAAAPANTALVSFDGGLNPATALTQITAGVSVADLPALEPQIGPATPGTPLALAGTQSGLSASYTSALANQFNLLAAAGQPGWRVFPLYDEMSTPPQFNIVGFIAARVIEADVRDDRLAVTVEPTFLIETTAWTVSPTSVLAPERNPYIHKLRLSR